MSAQWKKVCHYFLGMSTAVIDWRFFIEALPGQRPFRSTRGKGGAVAQLAAVAELIRPDLGQGTKRSRTKEIPMDVPANPMAPAKKRQGVRILQRFSLHVGY